MFRSQLFDHLHGAVFRAWCCYYFCVCLRRQVVYLVCGCMLSMCVRDWMYLSVGCLVVNCLLLRVGAARVHIMGLVL
jgi:hypothetical protein